ncbi:MAG: SDR family NAD(P)-dependent oxidoreductase, partial [Anaerolineae bacterium]|nr:SDR family NAD(P)-dependent oxidoreductase [Anaerolineae bacterium]
YHIIDWTPDAAHNPQMIRAMMLDILAWVEEGSLNPLPVHTFPLEQASAAFRYMAQAKHIGKIAVSHYHPGAIRPDVTYFITGGLSGLGLLTGRWLADNGARHLVLMGRRAPDEDARRTLADLEAHGVQIAVMQGDVSLEDDIRAVLAQIESSMPPLRGIIHSAGALADAALMQQDWSKFETVFAAKVDGTWLLHTLTQHLSLDFFVMYSSVAALFGSRGQSNHAAANAFMDALAYQRRASGLPGLSINWGAWGEIGAAVERGVQGRAAAQGIGIIPPDDGLAILGRLLVDAPAQVGVSPVDWPVFLIQFDAPFFAEFAQASRTHQTQSTAAPAAKESAASVLQQITEAVPAKRRELLVAFVQAQVARVLGAESPHLIDEHTPMNSLGLDSLMAVELRNRLSSGLELKRTLPATLVFDYPTVAAMTNYLLKDVLALDTEAAAAPVASTPTAEPGASVLDMLDTFENLSDEEVERLLAEHMKGDEEA